jgi:hypothetical protein
MSSWYPNEPSFDENCSPTIMEVKIVEVNDPWKSDNLKYTSCNKWQSVSKERVEACRRHKVNGVEARLLPKNHPLHGEYGLFAVQKFYKYDVIGEYTGKIVGDDVHGHYVAALEDNKVHDLSLGLDAGTTGNEMRFINSFLNVSFGANVVMRTAYVNTYPHIMIVCTEDIMPDDEILLDYGDAYNSAYLLPKPVVPSTELSMEEMSSALPFCGEDSDDEEKEVKIENIEE